MASTDEHPEALPHGPIEEVFDDVFVVTGAFKMNPVVRIPRNMTIVRQGDSLSLINAIRLSAAGEAELEKLGEIGHVIKLGNFHTRDDPYVVERFGAEFWALPKARNARGLKPDHELSPDAELPIEGARAFVFEIAHFAEAAVRLPIDGGVLVTCDAVQNLTSGKGMSLMANLATRAMGMRRPASIGKPWRKANQPRGGPSLRGDFDRLLAEVEFRHLLSGHGTPLKGTAKEDLRATVKRIWG